MLRELLAIKRLLTDEVLSRLQDVAEKIGTLISDLISVNENVNDIRQRVTAWLDIGIRQREGWCYIPSDNGLTTTDSVILVGNVGGYQKNYLTSLQVIATPLSQDTFLTIHNGVSAVWRFKVPTAGGAWSFVFPVPLHSQVGISFSLFLEVDTTTGGVFVNAQGFSEIIH